MIGSLLRQPRWPDLGTGAARDRQGDQALARIRMGDPRSASELLHECVLAAVATGGRVPAIRLRRARVELRPWRREDFVANLDDHLMDVLGG
ncbi:hypothetical protein ACF07L_33280 [Streptomyces anulatus]|uniref:hypothetical protein n=1 Tax=Streptomyces anulatus TaxID=1892 RepID=UPI003701BFB4